LGGDPPYPLGALGNGNNLAILGGVHVGYYRQAKSNIVLGVVGEFNLSNFSRNTSTFGGGAAGNATSSLSLHDNWQAFLMGRAGYAINRWLVYGAGGLALASFQGNLTVFDPDRSPVYLGASSQTKTLVGWAVGLGAEYAIDARWRVNGEIRYADFGKASYALPQNLSRPGSATSYSAGFTETIGLFGVSYRF
jgi:outer membrane immunogenic protein